MIKAEVTVWGKFACFTRSDARLNRISYDVPTPSACRGILEAIYCKPKEFWYEISEIRVLKPIRHIDIKKNEVKSKISVAGGKINPIDVNEKRTQRMTSYLADVKYTICANIHVRDSFLPDVQMCDKEKKIRTEFNKRVTKGKCFYQPYLGTRECMCFFKKADPEDGTPVKVNKDLGIMLYDIFDPESIEPLDTSKKESSVFVTYYHPVMIDGVITVPGFDSGEIFKPAGVTA